MYSNVPPPLSVKEDESNLSNETSCSGSKEKDDRPKSVPKRLWDRFKAIEKITDDATRRTTEKRMKHLKKTIVEKVQEEITLPEDQDILRKHDVKFGPPVHDDKPKHQQRKRKSEELSSSSHTESETAWEEVKPYLKVNEHLQLGYRHKYAPNSKTEDKIYDAIKTGDFSTAETLSDQLSQRQFGSKLATAFEARDYIKKKKIEEVSKRAKKKKTLQWGFQQKQRWETKSNM